MKKGNSIRILGIFLATCLLAVVAGCNPLATRPDTKAYDANTKVTAVAKATLRYVALPNCNAAPPPCAQTAYVKRLVPASEALSDAQDAYVAAVRDPAFAEGGLARYAVAVNQAIATLSAILLELGIKP
jgi:hypothetical protein